MLVDSLKHVLRKPHIAEMIHSFLYSVFVGNFVQAKKETKQLREFENNLLSNYKRFLEVLESSLKGTVHQFLNDTTFAQETTE